MTDIENIAQENALWLMQTVVEYTALIAEVTDARDIHTHDDKMRELIAFYVSTVDVLKTFEQVLT